MKACRRIASLLSASSETQADVYVLQHYADTVYKTKDETCTRASLLLLIT